jgi:hypothetical protein
MYDHDQGRNILIPKTAALTPEGMNINCERHRRAKTALTINFKDTIKDRVAPDPSFREELLEEGMHLKVQTVR